MLEEFWRSKQPYGIGDIKHDEETKKAKKAMSNESRSNEALSYWSVLLYNIGAQDAQLKKMAVEKKQNDLDHAAFLANRKAQQEKEEKEIQKGIEQLAVFRTLPNDLQKIELTLNRLTRYRRLFQAQYLEIPNYQDLKKKIGDYEAQVVNIAYKAYLLMEFKNCLNLINDLDKRKSEQDSRILAIKIYCMQKEKFPAATILAAMDQLLKLEPNNQRVFMLKKMLEAQEEYKQRIK